MNLPLTSPVKKPYCDSDIDYFTVGDLKQYAYCARIPYFTKALGLEAPCTYLMERGKIGEETFDRRQKRHRVSRFGLHQGLRHTRVWVSSQKLEIRGVIDLVIESENEIVVVDFKTGKRSLRNHHDLQIAAYSLLAEEHFGKPCQRGYLFYADTKVWVEVPITDRLRGEALNCLQQMKEATRLPIFPEPTPDVAKCQKCEYLNFCGDRW